jgi:dipeptidyl aminopeptidase/acylaminoacyl peptidase
MDPAWSPPTRQYAFVTDRTGTQQIWLRSQEAQWERPLVTEQDFGDARIYLLSTPEFSPDGQRLAYVRLGQEGYGIWISTLAGGPPVRLGTKVGYQDAPTWSPDGLWIAHVFTSPTHWSLGKTRVGGAEPPVLIKEDINPFARPQWSPDGQWILYNSVQGLALVSPEGNDSRVLSEATWLAYGWGADSLRVYGIRQSDDLRHLTLATIDIKSAKERIITANLAPVPLAYPPVRGFSRISDKSFATSIVRVRSDVWLLDGFQSRTGWFERFWPMRSASQQ